MVLAISDALVFASLPLIERLSLNATDALILRSALDIATMERRRGDDLALVASDMRLLQAAQKEGLVALNPETDSPAKLDALT